MTESRNAHYDLTKKSNDFNTYFYFSGAQNDA